MNPKWMPSKIGPAVAWIVVAAGLSVAATPAVPSNGAAQAPAADVASPMEACQAGKAPDASQTVFLSGTSGAASYPRGVNPDNAIFPGDVVRIEITGQLRYNEKEWAGPAGTGTPDANGIRPYAATATWNNRPDGPVEEPMAAVLLRTCTAAPSKNAVRLLYGIKDKDLSDNRGGFTITTHVWKAPGRLTIDRTEITQGVQNRSGQVALIAKKRTFLRVFLRHQYDGSTTMAGVTGTLRVPGLEGTTLPLVNSQITSLTNGGDPRRLENSLLFEVPSAALGEGARQLVVTVTPPANRGGGWPIVRHVPVEFGPMTTLRVIGLRYSYFNVPQALTRQHVATQPGLNVEPGWWQARSLASWQPMRMMAENVLPLARLSIADDAPAGTDGSAWGTRSFNCQPGQRADGLWYCGGYLNAITWAKGYADTLCPAGGCLVVLLQPERELTGNATGTCFCLSFNAGTPAGNNLINLQGERLLANQGNTLAHEIGHYLRLQHTWEDPHFEYRDDPLIGDIIGFRYAPTIQLEPQRRLDGTSTYDLMTYKSPVWFSVYSYCKAMHNLAGRNPVCSPGWDQ